MRTHPGFLIFRVRNFIFPILYLTLFMPSAPIGGSYAQTIAGIILLVFGIWIRSVTIGLEYIIRGGRNRQIHASLLVTGGIYASCRNPMYLGNLAILASFGLLADSLLFIAIVFPVFLLIYTSIIRAEEFFLKSEFGNIYVEYKKHTPMLIPKPAPLLRIISKEKPDIRRILRKEYNSWYLYLSGLLVLLFIETTTSRSWLISLQVGLTLLWLIIKLLKRKGILT